MGELEDAAVNQASSRVLLLCYTGGNERKKEAVV
jgi:hypothetical protein